jgi:hypothetical protein
MRRILSSALVIGLFSLPVVGLVGCSEEVGSKTTEKVTAPTGTTTTEVDKTIKSSGSNPPVNSEGQRAEPKN